MEINRTGRKICHGLSTVVSIKNLCSVLSSSLANGSITVVYCPLILLLPSGGEGRGGEGKGVLEESECRIFSFIFIFLIFLQKFLK